MDAILEASGADYAPGVLLQIVGAKIATTAVCRSSGLVGGVYAPSIFMGALLPNPEKNPKPLTLASFPSCCEARSEAYGMLANVLVRAYRRKISQPRSGHCSRHGCICSCCQKPERAATTVSAGISEDPMKC